jgi:hypothetical protein
MHAASLPPVFPAPVRQTAPTRASRLPRLGMISWCPMADPSPSPTASAPRLRGRPGRRWWSGVVSLALLLLALTGLTPPAQAAMDYAKQVLIGADFHGADLRGVTFNLTNLRDADLHDADLRGASLFGAKLQDANLSGADLRGATLDSAVFQGTDLRNARLDDAFAFNTRFLDVRIDGADFTGVPLRGDALRTLCAAASGTHPISGHDTRDTLGC